MENALKGGTVSSGLISKTLEHRGGDLGLTHNRQFPILLSAKASSYQLNSTHPAEGGQETGPRRHAQPD